MYERLSLQPGEFRVFQLDPSHDPSAPVVGHLLKASLDDPPRYDALSYRWAGSHGHTIDANGAQLPVTENLLLALKGLRQAAGPQPLTLWVDSICINQASIAERSQQVPCMGQIYTGAQNVRLWLGDEGPGVEAAFKLIHDCDEASPEDIVARVLGDENGSKALTKVLQRPYWGRMWMFQEIVLAQSAVVHCGSYEAPWAYFKCFNSVTADLRLWEKFQVEQTWIRDLREAFLNISHFGIPVKAAQDINAVLIPTRRLKCQDPRDKLYALLGVCDTLADKLVVDYSVSTRDVYTSFAKSQIESDSELYTLLCAGLWDPASGEDLELPSWVPDLREIAGFDTRYLGGAYNGYFESNGNGDDDSVPSFSFSEKDEYDVLDIKALLFDTVEKSADWSIGDKQNSGALVDTFCMTDDGDDLSVPKLRSLFSAIVFENSKSYRDEERMRRLILGFFEDLRQLYGSRPALVSFLKSLENIGLDLLQGGTSDPLELFSNDELHHNRLEYLGKAAQNNQDGRESAVFSTHLGHLGIGSSRVAQGDTIAIVQGSRVPLVLRKHGKYFRLVGPSYVSGLMQGEAVVASGGTSAFERVQLV